MNKIPVPVLIGVIVVALILAAFGAKSAMSGDSRYDRAKIDEMQKGAKGGHTDEGRSQNMMMRNR